jgi:hypothetical protein
MYFTACLRRSTTVAGFRSDPTLTASISGPSYVASGQQGTWTAVPSGGRGSGWRYKWYTKPVGGSWTYEGYECAHKNFWKTVAGAMYIKFIVNDDENTSSDVITYISSNAKADIPFDLVSEEKKGNEDGVRMIGNRPNPFNPSTTIEFELTRGQIVKLEVLDMTGRKLAELANGYLSSGDQRQP